MRYGDGSGVIFPLQRLQPARSALPAPLLKVRKGRKRDNADTSGQHTGEVGQHVQVCGNGQQKTARSTVLVHVLLDRPQQFRDTLHLVNRQGPLYFQQTVRVTLRQLSHCQIVQCKIATIAPNLRHLHQGGLPHLTRTHHSNDREKNQATPAPFL